MIKVFLFDPTCLSYRVHVYKYFMQEFEKRGYKLFVYYNKKDNNLVYPGFIGIDYSFSAFRRLHKKERPKVSIFFLWLSYKWSLPFLLYSRLFFDNKIIVWSKGINIAKINQPIKNQLYYLRQYISHALILYSEYEFQFIKTNKDKVFVANNTFNHYEYTAYSGTKLIEDLKNKYSITEDGITLFVGRIQERKRIDLLVDIFEKKLTDHALIIVGPGMPDYLNQRVERCKNIYYLGPIYNLSKLSEIYSIADIFCIPGEIGLGINEAFFFGLPVVTTFIRPTSEMEMLFIDGENGFFYKKESPDDLYHKLKKLLYDKGMRGQFSENARTIFNRKGRIEYMRDGFINAIKYVTNE